MKNKKPELIIWDFDGVIADTEVIWLKNRHKLLNDKFKLNWDFETTNHYLGGTSDKTKMQILDKLGIKTDEAFWHEALMLDYAEIKKGIKAVDGVEDIMKNVDIKQCIATGGVFDKTLVKLNAIGFDKFFNTDYLFTVDMVHNGKPEPDLFLYAADKMNAKPENTIVIEDSIAGLTAAIRAGMTPIAFVGCDMNNNPEYINKVKNTGVELIFDNMSDIKKYLVS